MEAMGVLQTSFLNPPMFNLNDFNQELVRMIYDGWGMSYQTDTNSVGPAREGLPQTVPISVVLWGDSGAGKTTLARVLLPKALIVSHMDDLCNYTVKHDGIIFDDMSFTHIPREAQIHLVDNDLPRSIHCRYRTASIPAMTKKIFTTNTEGGHIFILPDLAIERRIKRIKFI